MFLRAYLNVKLGKYSLRISVLWLQQKKNYTTKRYEDSSAKKTMESNPALR